MFKPRTVREEMKPTKHHILVTGGAGFIGSFLVDKLIEQGHAVRILDDLEPQVHKKGIPSYVNKNAEFIQGDVRNNEVLLQCLESIDTVFHLAALVGVGQSMYDIERYMDINTLGTAKLMDVLINKEHDVKKLIVASSMSTYGEGAYTCKKCGEVQAKLRSVEQMKKNDWEVHCPHCSQPLTPLPTSEAKVQEITSTYALSKKDQEDIVMLLGKTYGLPSVALRYFNVYGPRQSLNNPYTGVGAIFLSRVKNNNPPLVFEDGSQSRDFVSVHDITQANILAMQKKSADYEIFNVGSGNQVTIKQVADTIIKVQKSKVKPQVTAQFRPGDVRHCFADITKIKNKLEYTPKITFEQGIRELIRWGEGEHAVDLVDKATQELKQHDLLH